MDEPIDLEAKRKERDWAPYFFICGDCGGEDWTLWSDGPAQCSDCGCVAPNVEVREAG